MQFIYKNLNSPFRYYCNNFKCFALFPILCSLCHILFEFLGDQTKPSRVCLVVANTKHYSITNGPSFGIKI